MHGSHNMKEMKSSNHLWIDEWLDYYQNHEKCEIVGKDDVQTHDNKIMFIQSHCVVHIISAMFRCTNKM
jgi:hypothetical protein